MLKEDNDNGNIKQDKGDRELAVLSNAVRVDPSSWDGNI